LKISEFQKVLFCANEVFEIMTENRVDNKYGIFKRKDAIAQKR